MASAASSAPSQPHSPPPAATFPIYDGNGNVVSLVDATGSAVASYEYDPFGRTLSQAGPAAAANPFRFSTKYFDPEIGLYYYGYRYYAPEMGTWLNRDPIEEKGGLNLYAYVYNSPIALIDILGKNCCGPDVTDAVKQTLINIETAFKKIPNEKQRSACESLYAQNDAQASWDILSLANMGRLPNYKPFKGAFYGTGKCKQTVMFNGRCRYAGGVNYAAYGKMNQLCNAKYKDKPFKMQLPGIVGILPISYPITWSLGDIQLAVMYRKHWQLRDFSGTASDALDAATFGYLGSVPWLGGSIALGGSVKNCSTGQSKPILETELRGQWNGYQY